MQPPSVHEQMPMIQTRGGVSNSVLEDGIQCTRPCLYRTQQQHNNHKQRTSKQAKPTPGLARYRRLPSRKQCILLHKPPTSQHTQAAKVQTTPHTNLRVRPGWLAADIRSINYLSGHGSSTCNPHTTPSLCLYIQSCFNGC